MPFTLSHAAAALPLRHVLRGAAVLPALVIGCFLPDVPYFLPTPLYNINVHQLPGLLLFGIPCGWVIYALWFGLLREPSAALLPQRYAALLLQGPTIPQRRLVRAWSITVSLLAGAVSHIVWDAFTHRRGFVVHAWPALAQPVVHVGAYALPPYFVLQHGSTFVGFLWLALHVRQRLRQVTNADIAVVTTPQLSTRRKIAVVAALAIFSAAIVCGVFSTANAPRLSPYNFVCTCISAAAAVALMYALAWRAHHRHAARRASTLDDASHG